MKRNEIVSEILKVLPGAHNIIEETLELNISSSQESNNIFEEMNRKIGKYIIFELKKQNPNASFISKEMNITKNTNITFLIDPIDEIREFVNGWPSVISIACIEENELVCGVILEVSSCNVCYAIKDIGVYTYNLKSPNKIYKLEGHRSLDKKEKDVIVSYNIPSTDENFNITQEIAKGLYLEKASLKIAESASLGILRSNLVLQYMIDGYNHMYFNVEAKTWQIAAAICIVRELGCLDISLKDGTEITCEQLLKSDEIIPIAVTSSEYLLTDIYNNYISVVNKNSERFIEVMKKRKYDEWLIKNSDIE